MASAVEFCAEQLQEAMRPDSEGLSRDWKAEGGIGIPSLEDLTQPREHEGEQASRAMKDATARHKGHTWNNIQGDKSRPVKTPVLNRIQQVHFIAVKLSPSTDQVESDH